MSDEKLKMADAASEKIIWGHCANHGGPHVGSHTKNPSCVAFVPGVSAKIEVSQSGGINIASEPSRMEVRRFEPDPDSKSIHRWNFGLEDALRAIYRTWGEKCEDATELLQLVKRLKERETALEESNALLMARCDSAYRRGRENAGREFRRKVAELMLVAERE